MNGSKSIDGFRAVACSVQTTVYPFLFLGYNDSSTPTTIANSSYCFNAYLKNKAYAENILFYRNFNQYADILDVESSSNPTGTNCQELIDAFNGDIVTIEKISNLDESMVLDSTSSAEIEASITTLES